jgi:two-component system cell cycle sensor histidine kinase/response regulator CckA
MTIYVVPLQEIKKAGDRAASLTRQLLTFSRNQVVEPRLLDVNAIVIDAERMLQRLIGEDIYLATSLDPHLGRIIADSDQIHQVILNLVVNSRDAMPDGGMLEISTKNVDVGQRASEEHMDAVPGPYVLLTVNDSGTGMDETTLQSIFDPFFTTKQQGKGTGLGLAMVYGIVRQSGGWIEVSSKLGCGASFGIYLPRVNGASEPERAGSATVQALQGSETILIVEDEDSVRKLTKEILESYGYQVFEAANATEALRIGEQHSDEIQLLLTDVILPGMNGKALTERLQELISDIKVIFMSGYPADVMSSRGVVERDVSYLPKPFSPESLAVKVREVLTGGSSSR